MSGEWETDLTRYPLDGHHFRSRATEVRGFDTFLFRQEIYRRFLIIDEDMAPHVSRLHGPPCAYHVVEGMLLARNIPGPVVECGCFKGAMTAKMSIVCKAMGKKLYVFDSFQGLPHAEDFVHYTDGKGTWSKNDFSGSKDEVEANVRKHGEIDVCHFVEGFFSDTLHHYDIKPSMIFIDVDLTTSMRTCVEHFWPRLAGPRFYSHEAQITTYADALLDKQWWNDKLGCNPPPNIGCFTGFPDAPALCYLKKNK